MSGFLDKARKNIRAFLLIRKRLQQPFTNFSRKKEFSIFSVCLLVSAMIWLLIKLSADYSTQITVEVIWQDQPKGVDEIIAPAKCINAMVESSGFMLLEEKYLSNTPVARLSMKKAEVIESETEITYILKLNEFSDDLIRQCGFETHVNSFSPGVIRARYLRKVPDGMQESAELNENQNADSLQSFSGDKISMSDSTNPTNGVSGGEVR